MAHEIVLNVEGIERDDGGVTVFLLGEDGLHTLAEYSPEQVAEMLEADE